MACIKNHIILSLLLMFNVLCFSQNQERFYKKPRFEFEFGVVDLKVNRTINVSNYFIGINYSNPNILGDRLSLRLGYNRYKATDYFSSFKKWAISNERVINSNEIDHTIYFGGKYSLIDFREFANFSIGLEGFYSNNKYYTFPNGNYHYWKLRAQKIGLNLLFRLTIFPIKRISLSSELSIGYARNSVDLNTNMFLPNHSQSINYNFFSQRFFMLSLNYKISRI